MSDFSLFMKKNQIVRPNEKYPASSTLRNPETGKPLLWEFRPISTKESDALRRECTKEVPIPGKPNLFREKVNYTEFVRLCIAKSVVFPNLGDKALQDSYGVIKATDLLVEMVNEQGDWNNLVEWFQNYQGFNVSLEEKVEEAKN